MEYDNIDKKFYMALSGTGTLIVLSAVKFGFDIWSKLNSSSVELTDEIQMFLYLGIFVPAASAVYIFPLTREFLKRKFGLKKHMAATVAVFLIGLGGAFFTFHAVSLASEIAAQQIQQ